MTIELKAAARLHAANSNEHIQAALDPVADSLNHALAKAQIAKTLCSNSKQAMIVVQAIKDALTELQVLQEEYE